MLMKFIGGIAVCLSCSLIGLYLSFRINYRSNDLSELKKALLMLKAEIEFSRNSLPVAFGVLSERTEGKLSEFFMLISVKMSEKSGEEASLIWKNAVSEKLSKTYLEPDDIKCAERLGNVIGHPDSLLQLENIDMALAYIDETVSKLGSQNEKTSRMYKSVGVVSGVLITVVLI